MSFKRGLFWESISRTQIAQIGHQSRWQSRTAAPESSSGPTQPATHDVGVGTDEEALDISEPDPEDRSATDVGDKNVKEHSEQTTTSATSLEVYEVLYKSQERTNSSSALDQLEIRISTPSFTPEEHIAWLWNAAYDLISTENPKTLDQYESIVSSYVTSGHKPSLTPRHSFNHPELKPNAQVDHQARMKLMGNFLNVWLRKFATEEEKSSAGENNEDNARDEGRSPNVGNGSAMSGTMNREIDDDTDNANEVQNYDNSDALSLKIKLRDLVRESQHASLAWVATCLAMDAWLEPHFLPRTAQSEAISIFSKMKWYIGLSNVLHQGGHNTSEDFVDGNHPDMKSLTGMVIQLYKAILWYHISIVCHYRRPIEKKNQQLGSTLGGIDFNKYAKDIQASEEVLESFDGRKLQVELGQIYKKFEQSDQEDETTGKVNSALETLLSKLGVAEVPLAKLPTDEQSAPKLLYKWLCSTQQYARFRAKDAGPNERVLWLHGGPGAGKTMLLQMVVQELREDLTSSCSDDHNKIAYFFCDSNRTQRTSALSVVKSLVYHILERSESQPSLYEHLKEKFDMTERENFDEKNDFYAISTIIYDLLREDEFEQTYFIIDAIEELVPDRDVDLGDPPTSDSERESSSWSNDGGLDDLFRLISTTTKVSTKIKWLVSLDSERCSARLAPGRENSQAHLTINPDLVLVSEAIKSYSVSKVNELADQKCFNSTLRESIIQEIGQNARNFLWPSMAIDIVAASPTPWNAPKIIGKLKKTAPDVNDLYRKRWKEINSLKKIDKDLCIRALSMVAMAYRPLSDSEVEALLGLPSVMSMSLLVEGILSPFLRFYKDESSNERRIRFFHLSAKDFIRRDLKTQGLGIMHSKMAITCLSILRQTVKRRRSSSPAPLPDYAVVFWIKHLSEAHSDNGKVIKEAKSFLGEYCVAWIQILVSSNLLSQASAMIAELHHILMVPSAHTELAKSFRSTVRHVRTFLKFHSTSAKGGDGFTDPANSLLFWPSSTSLRQNLLKKHFSWVKVAPTINPKNVDSHALISSIYHPDYVRGCAFSPDGSIVASASDDRRVRLWDVETGKLQHVLGGFNDYVYSVVISKSGPNGRALIAAFESSQIRIWELYTGRLVMSMEDFTETTETTDSAAKAGTKKDELKDKDKNKDQQEEEREDHEEEDQDGRSDNSGDQVRNSVEVTSISITQDGKRIAAATGRRVTIWDIPETSTEQSNGGLGCKQTLWKNEESANDVNRIMFSPDGRLLALSAGYHITILNATTGGIKRKLPGDSLQSQKEELEGSVSAPGYAASLDSTQTQNALSGSVSEDKMEGTAVLEDGEHVKATADVPEWLAGHSGGIDGLAFSPDSKHLASGSDDFTARIWDIEKGTTIAVLRYHTSHVNSVSYSSDSVYLATGSTDETIAIWKRRESGDWGCDLIVTQPDQVLRGHSSMIYSVAFAPRGRFLASCTSYNLRTWDREIWESDTDANATEDSTRYPTTEQQSHETGNSSAASAGPGHRYAITSLAISRDGQIIASASSDGVICLWNGIDGRRLCTLDDKHSGTVKTLVFSQDGERLVSGSTDSSAMVWEIDTKEAPWASLMHRLEGHSDWIRAVAITPNRKLVATGSDDRTVRIWNISAVERRANAKKTEGEQDVPCSVLEGHTDWIYSMVFSPDGLRLVSADDEGCIMTWDMKEQTHEAVSGQRLGSAHARIRGIVYLTGGERLLTVDSNGRMAIWNSNDPEQERCVLNVDQQSEDEDFKWTSPWIAPDHPDVLLNEFGAWPYELKQASSSVECPRRPMPPYWSPVRIIDGGRRITWYNSREIVLPVDFQPAYSSPSWMCRVQGHSAVVGCASGQVLLFRFSDSERPEEYTMAK